MVVVQAEEVHVDSVTPKREGPAPGCLPGQTLSPEDTWITMVTPRAESQNLPLFGFLNAATTTLQRARPLVVKVALFSPGEAAWGRVGFKTKSDIREGGFLWLPRLQPHPVLVGHLPCCLPSSWEMRVQTSLVPPR